MSRATPPKQTDQSSVARRILRMPVLRAARFPSGLLLMSSLGCGPAGEHENLCPERSAIFGGFAQSSYLGIDEQSARSIGELAWDSDLSGCSGTLIASDWVLSAAHCAGQRLLTFGPAPRVVKTIVLHPTLDVALFQLEPEECAAASEVGLGVARFDAPLETRNELSRATLAGYGLTEAGNSGQLYFSVEAVVALDDAGVMMDGQGRAGACGGDSGGPLLVRDDRGAVSVLGVLSVGEPSCLGLDYYVRVDTLRSWIEEFVELPERDARCGGIDERGRCFDGRALWCEAGHVKVERCAVACGWSAQLGGYRCVETDRCTGDTAGECRPTEGNGMATVHCEEGAQTVHECAGTCGYDAESGRADCFEAPQSPARRLANP
jgi:hypothetical protein